MNEAAAMPASARRTEARDGLLQAVAAVGLFSSSPVLIRWAGGVGSLEIAFWRLALAAATVLCLAGALRRRIVPAAAISRAFALYGLVIALHFSLYIASLSFTTVAHALSLVYTAPIFIAILSRLWLGERLGARRWLGVATGTAGVAIVTGADPHFSREMALGDALAVGSAIAFAVYSVAGRRQRAQYDLFSYAAGVYAWGAAWLLLPAAWSSRWSHYDLASAGAVLALGIGPLGIGHTLYNAALRRIPATTANLIATLEVAGGVGLSALLLHEVPATSSLAGAAVVVAGIILLVA